MEKKNTVFYKCTECGNLIGLIAGDSENIKCCEKEMTRLEANSQEGATEKHLPVYEKVGDEIVVRVGEVAHPMDEEHYISWIAMMNDNRTVRVRLQPGDKPEVKFCYIPGATIYAYCNKHGLWKTEVE